MIGVEHGAKDKKMNINWEHLIQGLIATFVYSLVGVVMFAVGFVLIGLVAPFSLRKEIEEDQNVALGIMIGAVIIGLSIVIAAAITG